MEPGESSVQKQVVSEAFGAHSVADDLNGHSKSRIVGERGVIRSSSVVDHPRRGVVQLTSLDLDVALSARVFHYNNGALPCVADRPCQKRTDHSLYGRSG